MRDSMFDGLNLWVLKPNDANRGRGVQVFSNLYTENNRFFNFICVNFKASIFNGLVQSE